MEIPGLGWRTLERGFVFGRVRSDNHFLAEYGCRCRAAVQHLGQLAQRFRVAANVFLLQAHAVKRKKLFRRRALGSTGLSAKDYAHHCLSRCRLPRGGPTRLRGIAQLDSPGIAGNAPSPLRVIHRLGRLPGRSTRRDRPDKVRRPPPRLQPRASSAGSRPEKS